MVIGSLNTRVTVQTLTTTTDDGGGWSSSVSSSFQLWAKVENRTGAASYEQGQRQDNYDYKITVRYYPSQEVTTKNKILYGTKKLNINSVQIVNEGRADFYILNCSVHGN